MESRHIKGCRILVLSSDGGHKKGNIEKLYGNASFKYKQYESGTKSYIPAFLMEWARFQTAGPWRRVNK